MKEFQFTITDAQGIHARPAGLLVKKCGEFKSSITISKGEKSADAKRLFALMGLAIKESDVINVKVDGDDEEEACKAIEAFLKENL